MPTSKANTNTIAKIELNAIPPSFSSSVLFSFPKRKAAYNPVEINVKDPKLSLTEIEPLIPEEHDDSTNKADLNDLQNKKLRANVVESVTG